MNKDTDSRGVGLTGAGPRPGPPPVLRFDLHIPHPPSAVWRALTDPDLLALWWASGDVRAQVGHRFTLDMGPSWGVQPCEVTAVEPERLLEYHFAEGVLDTRIVWRLEPEDEGTRLYLTHAGFDLDSRQGRLAYSGMGNGWPHVLNGIERALDAVTARS
ncbi:MAG TPA: SRPBCC domain-containing protein [Actinospica sp.]|nr:SRPBCC domain-containing protein [Actinospica sp.]